MKARYWEYSSVVFETGYESIQYNTKPYNTYNFQRLHNTWGYHGPMLVWHLQLSQFRASKMLVLFQWSVMKLVQSPVPQLTNSTNDI